MESRRYRAFFRYRGFLTAFGHIADSRRQLKARIRRLNLQYDQIHGQLKGESKSERTHVVESWIGREAFTPAPRTPSSSELMSDKYCVVCPSQRNGHRVPKYLGAR